MPWKHWIAGILWTLAAPSLIVVGFALLTYGANARPQEGILKVSVEPQVIWPWQEAQLSFGISEFEKQGPLPAVDLILVVDISGSMTESLPSMGKAAREVAAAMPSGPGGTRFSLVRFDSEAETVVPWTYDRTRLEKGLDRLLPVFTGATDARALFKHLEALVKERRSGSTKLAAVLYSDGYLESCSDCPDPMSYDEIAVAARALREQGLQFFVITPPGSLTMSHPVLQQVAGPGQQVYESSHQLDLASNFERALSRVLGAKGAPMKLEQAFDARHFVPSRSADGWRPLEDGSQSLELVAFPGASTTRELIVEPRSMGWWSLGREVATLTRNIAPDPLGLGLEPVESLTGVEQQAESYGGSADASQSEKYPARKEITFVTDRAERRPSALVLTWWTLFLWATPALVWALANLPKRQDFQLEKDELLPIPQPRPPSPLPSIPILDSPSNWILPTLFLGIGGSGKASLEAIRGQLDEANGGFPGPFRFLVFDLDRQAPELPPAISAQAPVDLILAPQPVTDAAGYLPEVAQAPSELAWFDPERYRDTARSDLDLAGGARGDRSLARLALFRWLQNEDLLPRLQTVIEELGELEAKNGWRQVVVVASSGGGFGSGTFIDWGRLIRRLARDHQRQGSLDVCPEVVGLLLDLSEGQESRQHNALKLELQSARKTGERPYETDYGGDAPILTNTDAEPPYTTVFSVRGKDFETICDQAAQLATILTEAEPHHGLLSECLGPDGVGQDRPGNVQVRIRAIRTAGRLDRERCRLGLLARFLAPDLLVDGNETLNLPKATSTEEEEALDESLRAWAAEEPQGTPLFFFISACSVGSGDRLASAAQRWPPEISDWLSQALDTSVNRQLRGAVRAGRWQRLWKPSEARRILQGFSRRLRELPIQDPQALELAKKLAEAANSAASALGHWSEQAQRSLQEVNAERHRLDEEQGRLGRVEGSHIVARPASLESSDTLRVLEDWLGDRDVVSALRQNLYPALEKEGTDEVRVVVKNHIEESETHRTWDELLDRLYLFTSRLAECDGPCELEQVLTPMPERERQALAEFLVARSERVARALIVHPRQGSGSPEGSAIDHFLDSIPRPSDQGGDPLRIASASSTSIRRLELRREPWDDLRSTGFKDSLSAGPETQAERLCSRLERRYRRSIPFLPVPLRLALSNPPAFGKFAEAYASGKVLQRPDEGGRDQWYAADLDRMLTFGAEKGLDTAAAAYVSAMTIRGSTSASREGGGRSALVNGLEPSSFAGDFSELESWISEKEAPSAEILTLATIRLYQEDASTGQDR